MVRRRKTMARTIREAGMVKLLLTHSFLLVYRPGLMAMAVGARTMSMAKGVQSIRMVGTGSRRASVGPRDVS